MKKKIVICGAVRSVQETIESDMERIGNALADFDIRWIFIESDSDDATVIILKKIIEQDSTVRAEFCGSLQGAMPYRTQRLAHARNLYTKIVREEYPDVDYVVVADFDGLNSDINIEAVRSSFKRNDWDVVTSNQEDIYYDIWCLRAKGWIEHDVWQHYFSIMQMGNDDVAAFNKAIAPYVRNIPSDSDWIEVDGAHSGFLIFKREAFIVGTHVPVSEDGKETCEIVAYNKDLKNAGFRFFINPAMINAKTTDHSYYLKKRLGILK